MKRIGLIGEDPNDTLSIKNLLLQKHSDVFQYKQLIRNKKGGQLNNPRVFASLLVEFKDYNPHFIVFIKDADALPTEKDKIKEVINWFNKLNGYVDKRGLLLINIYELEALILADIDNFNKLFGTSIQFSKNVMYQKEPKEFLILKTSKNKKKYTESMCPEIFENLNIDTVLKNAPFFEQFYNDFLTMTKVVKQKR